MSNPISDTPSLCLTVDNIACQFPYMHKGFNKSACLAPTWAEGPKCPTELYEDGMPVPGSWGECKRSCNVGVR